MMTIEPPHGPIEGQPCAWCGFVPATLYELEKPRYTHAANGTRVVKKSALQAWACDRHRRQFDAQRED
jgi:hypothetical protein